MEILFLGTSAGVPTKARNVTAAAIKKVKGKSWVLIDCGEGTQQQVLRTSLSLIRLDAILITHVHGDHCYGLPGLLSSASMMGRKLPLTIIGPQPIKSFLDAVQATTGLHLTYPIEFSDVELLTDPFTLPGFMIEAAALSHGVASYAYAFIEKDIERKLDPERLEALGVKRGPDWGRLHRGEDVVLQNGTRVTRDEVLLPGRRSRKVVIAGDNDSPGLLERLCEGADVLVHEATYTQDVVERLGTNNRHSTAGDVASFAQRIDVTNLVLTHFSPRYQYDRRTSPSIADIENEAWQYYQGRLFLADDFAHYQLSREGELSQKE
ncbi:ribonuclease Z [Halomonas sp. PR-M31]|uniref:ribonuclease Z n=1 Tax=Halomonas sp. PR-M31 TaxID=1471202 RepID=UPI000651626C|nr:ribonuclease Z [Halomonas sp. PR-M31]